MGLQEAVQQVRVEVVPRAPVVRAAERAREGTLFQVAPVGPAARVAQPVQPLAVAEKTREAQTA